MELTTSEDIHIVCIFEKLQEALMFGEEIDKHRTLIKNKAEIFGRQQILDEEDNVVGEEEHLLINATDISIEDVPQLVSSFNGVCYPAHIDRESNGIVSVLGGFPKDYDFNCFEIYDSDLSEKYIKQFPHIKNKLRLVGSDAHYLWDIRDAKEYIELDDEPYSSELVRKRLFEYLRRKV